MTESYVQLPVDGAGKLLRSRQRAVGANTVQEQYVIPTVDRVVTNTGLVTTFRTLGAAATIQNLFSIENASGSTILVGVRRLAVQVDATAVLTAVMPQVKTFRISAGVAAGGTTLTAVKSDTTQTASVSVVCRGATSSDGGAATAITGTLDTPAVWQQYAMRMFTAVGQVLAPDNSLIPSLCETNPLVLQANQALVVQVVAAVTTSNPATNHWFVQCVFDEYTL